MMLILIGRMASGKSTAAKLLESNGFNRNVTDTTREKRLEEADGVNYHFLTLEKLCENADKGGYSEFKEYDASFGHVFYGSRVDSYMSEADSVIVVNPEGLRAVREQNIPCVSVYLRANKGTLLERLKLRGDKEEEITRRMKADDEDFHEIEELCDFIVDVDGKTPEEIVNEIMDDIDPGDDHFDRETQTEHHRNRKKNTIHKKIARNKRSAYMCKFWATAEYRRKDGTIHRVNKHTSETDT